MVVFLLVLSALCFGSGCYVAAQVELTKSAIHEIESLILFLTTAVLFVGAVILNELQKSAIVEELKTSGIQSSEKVPLAKLRKHVLKEIEAGSIDLALWTRAKEAAQSNENSAIEREYIPLRVQRLIDGPE